MRIPIVYPYVINAYVDFEAPNDLIATGAFLTNANSVDYARISSEDPPGGNAYMNDEYGDVLEQNIIAFSFNEKYLIGKKKNRDEKLFTNSSIYYLIFYAGI